MWLDRTKLLLKDKIVNLQNASVLVVGLGGVGSFAAEFLTRSGIGKITIVDGDKIEPTNINRQLPALYKTIGKYKTEVMAERLKNINPELELKTINLFIQPEDFNQLVTSDKFDYIIDAIDSVSPKVYLILAAKQNKIKIALKQIKLF